MAAVDLNTTTTSSTSTNVFNPQLILLDMEKHLEGKRHEGATVQALSSPEKPSKKKTTLHSTNKVSPTLSKKKQQDNFNNLYEMMLAILAMQSVLSENESKRQVSQATIGKSLCTQALNEQKNVANQIKKIEAAKHRHHHWWQKAFGWALAAIGALLAGLTAGLGAAFVIGAMAVLSQTGCLNKGFMKKINDFAPGGVPLGKIGIVLTVAAASGGVSAGIDTAAEEAGAGAASEGATGVSALAGGVTMAGSNNLLGTIIYDSFKSIPGVNKKKLKEAADVTGEVLLVVIALALGKALAGEGAFADGETVNKVKTALTAGLIVTSLGTAVSEVMAGVQNYKLAKEIFKYGEFMGAFTLFKDLTDMNTERQKEDEAHVQRQTSAFEQENQSFSLFTLPYRTIAQVLA